MLASSEPIVRRERCAPARPTRADNDVCQQLFPREDFEDALQAIYGFDLDYLEEDWLTMLSNN